MHCMTSLAEDLHLKFALLKLIVKLVFIPSALERCLVPSELAGRREREKERSSWRREVTWKHTGWLGSSGYGKNLPQGPV